MCKQTEIARHCNYEGARGNKITKEDEINPVAKREKERVVMVVVVVKKHERMNGGTKVARTYQPDIVGLIGGVQVQGNIVGPCLIG